ncbi:MAG: asparagine synthase (glutamine-hydrolyzing) [Vicinamibacterales bacterium]|nr:asparagine synthase (glutamine-hydrolyzing) [Vicinamibacterales bacterium]
MCGIAGMFGRPDQGTVRRMASAMVHRGPDDEGFHVDDDVALGFRRLSIIDVAGGRQPLTNEDGSVWLVFNGEIYNHLELRAGLEARGHQCRTHSDGEVLLHLYEERGVDFVDALNGIFACALWDSRARRLVLARDHHGVKPLYWAEAEGTFLFASELKAMLASGRVSREINREAVGQYLTYQAVPPPLTMVAGVHALPPGRVLVREQGTTTTRTYWTPPRQDATPITDSTEAIALVRTGLEQAVARQMMSERPLGLFLSGGVDSSALVALAAPRVPHRLKTFSVGFVGADEQVLTEWPWARIVAEKYDTDHQEVVLTESMFREALPHAFSAMDQPTSDGLNAYWVSWAAAQHVTVALSGTGGDELFLGYPRDAHLLAHAEAAAPWRSLPAGYVRGVMRALDRLSPSSLWPGAARTLRALRASAGLDREFVTSNSIAIFDLAERDAIVSRELAAAHGPFADPASWLAADVPADPARPGDWIARLEQRAYLSYVLLRDIDAMSMAHSLEVRVPMLDPRFTEAAARIPWEMKLRDGTGKWVLKQALRDLLPDEILFRPKMGFGLPYNTWMRRSVAPLLHDLLSPARVRRRGVFDPAGVERLKARFFAGDDGAWRRLWTLFVFEGWATEVLDAGVETLDVAA